MVRWMLGAMALLAVGVCARAAKENPALAEFPGARSQIEGFYNDRPTEDDWTCDEVELDTID